MIGFALDMDGTVYHGERPIPGAREFILNAVKAGVAVSVGLTDATAE